MSAAFKAMHALPAPGAEYREIAWKMKCKMEEVEPELGRLIEATPPWGKIR